MDQDRLLGHLIAEFADAQAQQGVHVVRIDGKDLLEIVGGFGIAFREHGIQALGVKLLDFHALFLFALNAQPPQKTSQVTHEIDQEYEAGPDGERENQDGGLGDFVGLRREQVDRYQVGIELAQQYHDDNDADQQE